MRKMLIIVFVMCFTLCMAQPQTAQGQKAQRPDFKVVVEKRFEVIVHELGLDDSKAQQLRPAYMEYCKDMGKLFKPRKHMKPREQRTDEEVEADIKDDFARARKMLSLRETYYAKFRLMLTPRQIEKIYDIEREEQHRFRQYKKPKN